MILYRDFYTTNQPKQTNPKILKTNYKFRPKAFYIFHLCLTALCK